MLIFPDSPLIPETSPEEMTPAVPVDASNDVVEVAPQGKIAPDSPATEISDDLPAEELLAEAAPTPSAPQPPKPEPPMPWAVVVRRFAHAPADACGKLNADFRLTLNDHSYARLQNLFRTVLRRDPTVGELYLLDALDRAGRGLPCREAVGELYTDSPAIAETWADMMDKHSRLHAAAGLLRKDLRVPPPCTFEDALTLISRYLHRTGRVIPLSDGLPFGGKNSDGRTVVLSTPAQKADAIAKGYKLVDQLDFDHTSRSLWVRHGQAMAVTPSLSGDFLICLPSPDPQALTTLLEGERAKSHPAVGAIVALFGRSPLDAVLSLCDGADIYPARLPHSDSEGETGAHDLLRLCTPAVLSHDTRPDYLLRIPAKKVREMSEALRALGMEAVSVGQVKSGGKIRIYLRQSSKDIPVTNLPTEILRTYPSTTLFLIRVNSLPSEDAELPSVSLLEAPDAGLIMASASVTITKEGSGYTAAMKVVEAVVAPLTEGNVSTRDVRLSVSVVAADGEGAHGSRTLELLCGLYRAAAEGGMAVEDPALTVESPAPDHSPCVHLSVVAYRRV